MPYCPKCNQEFVEGVTVCTDCGTPLVETAEVTENPVKLIAIELSLAERLTSFLVYSKIEATTLPEEGDENLLQIFVPESQLDDAKKLVQVFLTNEPTEEENIPLDVKPAHTYRNNAARYEDMRSSAFAFLVVGALVLVVMGLSLAGVISLPFYGNAKYLVHGVMITLGILFLIVGFVSRKQAKALKETIGEDDTRTAEILHWFLSTYTAKQIDETIDAQEEEIASEEIRSLKRMDIIREYLVRQYQIEDESYLDLLCEEVYQKTYES